MLGAAAELTAKAILVRRLGETAEPYRRGRPGAVMRVAETLTAASLGTALVARHSRTAAVLSGTALVASSALTRLGIFEAGMASARDPKYTIRPQAERARQACPARRQARTRSERSHSSLSGQASICSRCSLGQGEAPVRPRGHRSPGTAFPDGLTVPT